MQVIVHSSHDIDGRHDKLAEHVEEVVEKALKKVSSRITRVEVHLTQEHADVKCVMEARLEHHQPTAVSHQAPKVHLAVDAAAGKMQRALSHMIGKMRDTH